METADNKPFGKRFSKIEILSVVALVLIAKENSLNFLGPKNSEIVRNSLVLVL